MARRAAWAALLLAAALCAPARALRTELRQAVMDSLDAELKDTPRPTTPTFRPTTPVPVAANVQDASTTPSPTAANFSLNVNETTWQELPQWAQIVLSLAAVFAGLVNTYAGYRFFRFSIFVIGGFIVFVIMVGILEASISDATANKAAIVYGVSAACWVVGGLILVALTPVAIFVMGASIGVVIAIVLNPLILYKVWPENPEGNLYIWMAVFGVITGLITLCFERPILIVATTIVGSLLVILGIGGMAGNLPTWEMFSESNIPWESWAYLGGFLGLLATGLIAQMCFTAVGRDHRGDRAPAGYTGLEG